MFLKYLFSAIIFCYAIQLSAQTATVTDAWQSVLTITDQDGTSLQLRFGKAAGATSGLDSWLNEVELPPYPPSGIFDARFLLEAPYNTYSSLSDIRSAALTAAKWRTRVQQGSMGFRVTYRWDPATLPSQGTFFLQDEILGTLVNVNMRNANSYINTNSALNVLLINAGSLNPVDNYNETPLSFTVGQNYPNPFNPSTTIPVALPHAGKLRIEVFNALGVQVAVLADGYMPAGEYQFRFQASVLPSGLYYCRVTNGVHSHIIKMAFVK